MGFALHQVNLKRKIKRGGRNQDNSRRVQKIDLSSQQSTGSFLNHKSQQTRRKDYVTEIKK
jgi:hypothetical protein